MAKKAESSDKSTSDSSSQFIKGCSPKGAELMDDRFNLPFSMRRVE